MVIIVSGFHFLTYFTIPLTDQNRSLSSIQKLHYLKTSLKNEPARLLPATSANYEVAIKLLEERYINKRMITHTHLDAVFKFKPLKQESPDQIRNIVGVYVENTMALEAMGMDIQASDFMWVYLIAMKLDSETRQEWELHTTGDGVQTMASMRQFLEKRARALDFSAMSRNSSRIVKEKSSDKEAQLYQTGVESTTKCPKCSATHALYHCDQSMALSIDERVECVKKNKICFNCSKAGHALKECKSKSGCQNCKKRHNTMLHRQENTVQVGLAAQSSLGHEGAILCCSTLLPTALVKIKTVSKGLILVRALLDSGSQVTCITEKCVARLGLQTRQSDIQISGIGGNPSANSVSIVQLELVPPYHSPIHTIAVVLERVAKLHVQQCETKFTERHTMGRSQLHDAWGY